MRKLGPSIVKLAVESTGSDAEVLHSFHRTAFETEVLDALMDRYGESRIDVLRWYCERNDKEHALTVAERNLTSWSDEEVLSVIMSKLMLRPRGLLDALTSRKTLVEAVQCCLSADSFDLSFAEAASNKELKSIRSASQNVDELLKVWNARRNVRQVKELLSREAGSSLTVLFWRLFDNPKAVDKKYRKKCMQVFGKDIVRKAVLASAPYKNDSVYSVLCLFDKKAFASDKPAEPKRTAQSNTATGSGDWASNRGDRAASHGDQSTKHRDAAAKKGDEAKRAGESKFHVGDRVILTGLKKKSYLNGQPGRVKNIDKKQRYIVVLDSDKKGTEPKAVFAQNLVREESGSSDSSGLPNLMPRTGEARNNDASSIDSDSSYSMPPLVQLSGKKASRSPPSQHQQNADSDDSSMPSLCQDGYKSSSSDDESVDPARDDSGSETDMPELESKASSEDSTGSDGALPIHGKQAAAGKKKTASAMRSRSRARKEEMCDDSSQNSSVPSLEQHPPMVDGEDSSDSSILGVPDLVADGSGSSDEFSEAPGFEPPRYTRNYSSDSSEDGGPPKLTPHSRFKQRDDSDSEGDLPSQPTLEVPHGAKDSSSDDDASSSDSSNPPELKPRLGESSDDDMLSPIDSSDDEPPELMDRDGEVASQARAPRQSQRPPQNAPAAKKRKGKRGRRNRGGRGGKK
jgi:hypothetical protein